MIAPPPSGPDIRLEEDLGSLVRLGLVRAEPVRVGPSGGDLLEEIDRTCSELAARHAGASIGSIPGVETARGLYRAFGIDPTRHRPSSEALLRRVIRHKPFPRVSNAVDLCNLLAVRFLLPLGLYDTARISGGVALRRGRPEESYEGIRKDAVRLGGRPVLADERGPFGNPTSDSLRTSVGARTESLWMVIFAPAAYDTERLKSHLSESCAMMARHLVGEAAVAASGRLLPSG